jgi:hypothetical protein
MQCIEVHGSGCCPEVDQEGPAKAGDRERQGCLFGKPVLSRATSLLCALAMIAGSSLPLGLLAATRSPKQRIVPNWARCEQVFISTFEYTNALQEANLLAVFTSPLGDRRIVSGFWDGGRVWRVRFCPDIPGQWTFTTFCSDSKNFGLDGHTDKFLCTAQVGESPFRRHGPVRVARDHRHFEHADGTPFFWLADSAGSGAFLSNPKDWQRYALIRSSQRFNAAVWSATPQEDFEHESALKGLPDRIGINPAVFQRLDAKLETLSREGILSAIIPFSDEPFAVGVRSLPEDQAALVVKYMMARWGTEPVAWVVDLQSGASENQIELWKRIGSAAFTNSFHAPVIVFSSESSGVAGRFRDQPWVDAFGVDAPPDSSLEGNNISKLASAQEGFDNNAQPIILLTPRENGIQESHKRFNPDDVRHAVYEKLLMTPPAGVTYAAQGVIDWNTSADPKNRANPGAEMPLWEKALFLPGAKQMRSLANLMNSIDFWRLRPRPDAVPNPPGQSPAQERVVAACTSARDLTLVYLPQANPVDVYLQAMPESPLVNWIEPRQGSTRSAVAVVSGSTCQFPPPGEGDWVLLIKSSK